MCADRGSPFDDEQLASITCESVIRCSELRRYRLYGFFSLPDRLYVLLSPEKSGIAVGRWRDAFKGFTTNEFMRLGGDAPLWQRSAHDHVCRDDETVRTVMRYIAENPVRGGLVQNWRDWP